MVVSLKTPGSAPIYPGACIAAAVHTELGVCQTVAPPAANSTTLTKGREREGGVERAGLCGGGEGGGGGGGLGIVF